MFKIGLSAPEFTKDFFEGCKKAGIEYIEISPPQDKYSELDFIKIAELSKSYDVKLWSFHLPFMPFAKIDISSLDKEVRKSTVEQNIQLIKKGSDIGIDKFIIHSSGEPITEKREDRLKFAKESLDVLAEAAYKLGGVVAVENLPRTCLGKSSGEILQLISANDKLRVCFDTNHLLSESITDFIKNVGNKIITTHISDYDFKDEKHWLPGEGDIDWKELFDSLKSVGYRDMWLYEVALDTPETITRARSLTFDDFVANANLIFNK